MSEISYVKGDATCPQAKGVKIISHVCNDIGGWGNGFVFARKNRGGDQNFKTMHPILTVGFDHIKSRWSQPVSITGTTFGMARHNGLLEKVLMKQPLVSDSGSELADNAIPSLSLLSLRLTAISVSMISAFVSLNLLCLPMYWLWNGKTSGLTLWLGIPVAAGLTAVTSFWFCDDSDGHHIYRELVRDCLHLHAMTLYALNVYCLLKDAGYFFLRSPQAPLGSLILLGAMCLWFCLLELIVQIRRRFMSGVKSTSM